MKELQKKYGEKWVKSIRTSLRQKDRVATGKTERSIKYKITDKGFRVVGASHLKQVIEGRGKSKSGNYPSQSFQNIKDWAKARGLPSSAVYPIFKKIHSQGWKGNWKGRNSKGGNEDLVSSVITKKEIDTFNKELAQNQLNIAKFTIKEIVKDVNNSNKQTSTSNRR